MILPGRSLTGATISASPASIALRGMPSNLAVAGSCTSTTPAFSLMARNPSVPSEPVQDGHVFVRRDHIDAVRLDPGTILDLHHFHAGRALEQFGHDAFARRVQMLDDEKAMPPFFGTC